MIDLLIYIIFFIFLYVVTFGHPSLVARIISQIETPFVIRIGLVTMTYAIPFAIFWFCSETSDEPKKNEESGGRNEVFMTLFILMVAIFFGFEAWQELQLRHQLLEEGGSAVATVQKCEKKKGNRGGSYCYMSYGYEVPLANTTKLYTVREEISCARVCNIGSSVDITYLPQTPTEARILGNRYFLKWDIMTVAFLLNVTTLYSILTGLLQSLLKVNFNFFVLIVFWDDLIQKWKRSHGAP